MKALCQRVVGPEASHGSVGTATRSTAHSYFFHTLPSKDATSSFPTDHKTSSAALKLPHVGVPISPKSTSTRVRPCNMKRVCCVATYSAPANQHTSDTSSSNALSNLSDSHAALRPLS